MHVDLDKEDIINEVKFYYENDVDLFFNIVEQSTTNGEPIRELIKRLTELLKNNYKIQNLNESSKHEKD